MRGKKRCRENPNKTLEGIKTNDIVPSSWAEQYGENPNKTLEGIKTCISVLGSAISYSCVKTLIKPWKGLKHKKMTYGEYCLFGENPNKTLEGIKTSALGHNHDSDYAGENPNKTLEGIKTCNRPLYRLAFA
ncbi:hypothetical protein U27_01447 [Candidatus Vecturithrix granuli]|uniref:Uncharacterized protein n=1 Tax=Vecturithrix granuli TaxID=1499967 RepID=A0A081CAE1_VECG1|nr:hypothetical protein U27_01447 [Candidatus Vecturithrix granuli]